MTRVPNPGKYFSSDCFPKPMAVESDFIVKPVSHGDVNEAARIFRLAFGTDRGLPDPMRVFGDRDFLITRWRANHGNAFGAYLNGKLVGSNIVSHWGTFGLFGPLSVHPDLWNKGIGSKLLENTMKRFSEWGTTHQGLCTAPESPKHIALYEKFGFSARYLTPIMTKKVGKALEAGQSDSGTFSGLTTNREKDQAIRETRELASKLHPGLDLADEIRAGEALKIGETVFVREDSRMSGFAVCQHGAGTEGGSGNCYVKFAAAMPGAASEGHFDNLISAIEGYALLKGLNTIEAGVNMGRKEAYKRTLNHGFRAVSMAVAMQKPNEEAFNRPGVYAMDDWR